MKKTFKKALIVAACGGAIAVSSPASAALYTYTQTNGDTLTIDSASQSGSLKGKNIDVTFTSSAFANFIGGATPDVATYNLDSLDGTRTVRGIAYSDNPSHQQALKFTNSGKRVNLWSWWGSPIVGGDYITYIDSFTPPSTPVPAPGILGLLALALAGLGLSRRRKTVTKQDMLAIA